jgi:uncharacterized protein (UPF0335 family)
MSEHKSTTFAKDQLKAIVERIERLEEEKKATSDDIRDVYAEAKGNGFDVKALRSIISLRKQDTDERREQQAVLETYMHALGMLSDLPLDGRPAEREFKDMKVVISSGDRSVETTLADMQRAADYVKTRGGKRKVRNPGNGNSSPPPPPQSPPAPAMPPPAAAMAFGHEDDNGIPTFIRRGHPDCRVGMAPS